jgi:VWFA-related protein
VRGLLRRRRERGILTALAVAALVSHGIAAVSAGAISAGIVSAADAAIEITSPIGRTGLPGKVRIVARVTAPKDAPVPSVRFFVDGRLLATDTDGPPYAAEWEDANPYERTRLAAELDDPIAGVVRTEVVLPAFEFQDEASVMSVGVEVTVQDARGRFVKGLRTNDFHVYEDGAVQAIDGLTTEAAPATFALLVDSSQSMSKNIGFVQSAAARITRYLRPVDSIAVAPFKNGISSVTGPTRDLPTVLEAVAAIKPVGGTAIVDSLKDVARHFGDGPGRRVVVLITDGYDERSELEADEVLDALKSSRVTVYVISIGGVAGVSIRGERLLRRIATETGGRAFFPWNESQLADVHATITDDVKHEYRITYTPSNQDADGTWRVIKVATADGSHRVLARPGYRAPEPVPIRASIEFTATDERMQQVDLTAGDIQVIEDGVPQALDTFTEAVAPVSIMLALDGSGSMTRAADSARLAAHAFVRALRADDPLGVLVFADKVEVSHDFTTKRELSHEAVEGFETQGGTALNDALGESAERLMKVKGRKVVVLVTDGRDENAASTGPGSERSWDQALAAVHAADATVYAIGLGVRVDQERLKQVAAYTGGEAYFTTDVAELDQHYRRIIDELHRRYVIGFTSTNGKRNGAWRQVELRTATAGVRLRSRGGYYAPAR